MKELKEKAQETYGNAYSDIAFHQAVLDIGPAPFKIIEKRFLEKMGRIRPMVSSPNFSATSFAIWSTDA